MLWWSLNKKQFCFESFFILTLDIDYINFLFEQCKKAKKIRHINLFKQRKNITEKQNAGQR